MALLDASKFKKMVVGNRPEILDSPAHAHALPEQAQRRARP
jgi:hypothetical protein